MCRIMSRKDDERVLRRWYPAGWGILAFASLLVTNYCGAGPSSIASSLLVVAFFASLARVAGEFQQNGSLLFRETHKIFFVRGTTETKSIIIEHQTTSKFSRLGRQRSGVAFM